MPQLDHSGPEGKGRQSGRKLGKCKPKEKSDYAWGEGMAKKRKTNEACEGEGKRIKSGKMFSQT